MMDGLTDGVAALGAGLLLLRDQPAPLGSEPTLTTAPLDAAVLVGCSGLLRESLAVGDGPRHPGRGHRGRCRRGRARGSASTTARRSGRRRSHLRALGHERGRDRHPAGARRVAARLDRGRTSAITVDVTRERLAGARDVFPDAAGLRRRGELHRRGPRRRTGALRGSRDAGRPPSSRRAICSRRVSIRAAEEAGLRVPEDVSVTGFDGIVVDGLAPYELTTLVQPAAEKGRAAGQAVAAMLDGRERGIHPLHLRVPRGQHHRAARLSRCRVPPRRRRRTTAPIDWTRHPDRPSRRRCAAGRRPRGGRAC